MLGAITFPEFIFFLLTVISTTLYILLLSQLIKHRHQEPFNSHFFALFVSIGFADLGNTICSHVFVLFKSWGWLDWTPIQRHPVLGWWAAFCSFSSGFYFTWSQYIGVVELGINRFAQLVHNYEFLDTRILALSIFLQWSLPTVAVVPFMMQNFTLVQRNFSGISYLVSTPPPFFFAMYNLISGFVLPSIVNITISILYVRMYLSVRNLIKDYNLQEKAHVKLALMGFALFLLMGLLEIILVLFALAVAIDNNEARTLFSKLGYHALVLFSISNPWLLILCSKPTKLMMLSVFKKPTRVEPIR